MRPSHVIPLTWLPLNSNGKTDAKILADIFKRLAVQELTGLMAEDKADSSTRCSETEETVYSILKQHAPSHPGAPYPDLSVFECGLDSMGVIRFTSDLKARFRTQLSASDIMKNPLLKDIAQLVLAPTTEDDLSTPELVSDSAIHEVHSFYPLGTVETVLPPFPIQQGVVSRSAELDSLYVQHVILQCHDGVSLPKLKEAWRSVYARHPMLRCGYF
jgi:acyl carrier protein